MSDKLIARIKADVETALKANTKAMDKNAASMSRATDSMMGYNKKLREMLDKRIKAYDSSINQLFALDGWRRKVFWAGIVGGILTPVMLIVNRFL